LNFPISKHLDLTVQQGAALKGFIIKRCKDGKPKHGVFRKAANEFSVYKLTLAELWQQWHKNCANHHIGRFNIQLNQKNN